MYLIFSGCCLLLFLGAVIFAARGARQKRTLRRQLLAFHAAGAEQDKRLAELQQTLQQAHEDTEKWRNAAESARMSTLLEVQNLLTYNGTEAGQHDLRK